MRHNKRMFLDIRQQDSWTETTINSGAQLFLFPWWTLKTFQGLSLSATLWTVGKRITCRRTDRHWFCELLMVGEYFLVHILEIERKKSKFYCVKCAHKNQSTLAGTTTNTHYITQMHIDCWWCLLLSFHQQWPHNISI